MIRNRRRLGDATGNITNTIGPTEATSPAVMNWITASLASQGIDAAAATPAQIMNAYTGFASLQTFSNLSPVFPGSTPPAVSAGTGPVVVSYPIQSMPRIAPAPQTVAPSPLAALAGIPSWVKWAAGAGAALLLLRK